MSTRAAERLLWLHIGLPKTGSSFIQSSLRGHADELAEQGYLYPRCGQHGDGHFFLALPFLGAARRLQSDVADYFEGGMRDLWPGVVREADESDARTLLISSEYFSEAENLDDLANACAKVAGTVRVLVYLRRQDRLMEAGYNQDVKAGFGTEKLKVGDCYVRWHDFEKRLEPFEMAFGRAAIIVRTYESAVSGGDLLADFCGVVGLDRSVFGDTGYRNERLHPALVEIKRYENALGFAEGHLTSRLLGHFEKLSELKNLSILPAEKRRAFLEPYHTSNARVAAKYLGDDSALMFGPVEEEGDSADAQAPAILTAALVAAWNEMQADVARLENKIQELSLEIRELKASLPESKRAAAS
jgi:hypothetical protein